MGYLEVLQHFVLVHVVVRGDDCGLKGQGDFEELESTVFYHTNHLDFFTA